MEKQKLLPLGDLEPPRVLWEQIAERSRFEVIKLFAKLIQRAARAATPGRREEAKHELPNG